MISERFSHTLIPSIQILQIDASWCGTVIFVQIFLFVKYSVMASPLTVLWEYLCLSGGGPRRRQVLVRSRCIASNACEHNSLTISYIIFVSCPSANAPIRRKNLNTGFADGRHDSGLRHRYFRGFHNIYGISTASARD